MLFSLLLTSCAIANLRTEELVDEQIVNAEAKGRDLLQFTYEKMGYSALKTIETYGLTAHFTWSPLWGSMPMNSLPGAKNKDIRMRFAANTFDGQMEFLEGKKKGQIEGVQSFQAYDQASSVAKAETRSGKRYPWGLATYHYLTESSMRILGADIVRYAGETTFDGKGYNLVFLTWGDGTDKKNYDQWLVYINKATGFTDLVEVTITDFFLPMPGGMKNATVRFASREKTAIGAYLPTKTVVQLGRPKTDIEKDVYTFTFKDFSFDSFDKKTLYPLPDLPEYGDSKPVK